METTEKFGIAVNPLRFRRGIIRVSDYMIQELSAEIFKLFYSNFYPVAIESDHTTLKRERLFYCFSEHFREVDDATIAPEYRIFFKYEGEQVMLDRVEEVTK